MPSKPALTVTMRRMSQVGFFILFLLTVLQATYPFRPWLPPELFLWLDPLSTFLPAIANRHFETIFLLSLIVLLSPLLVGRAFCGWVCPLGTTIDLSDKLVRRPKFRINPRWKAFKYALLVLILCLAICGFQYAWLMAPLPLVWRSFGTIILAFFFLIVDVISAILISIGIFPDTISRLQDKLGAYLFPLSTPNFTHLALPLLIFLSILLLSNLSRRFWCRHLCPLGALLGLIAKLSPLQRVVTQESCTTCGICRSRCKMAAIADDYVTTDKSECILCLSCSTHCPPKAIQYRWRSPQKMMTRLDFSRRGFLTALATGIIGAGYFKINSPDPRANDRLIRPPGAIDENEFLSQCIRCGECIRICATAGGCLQMTLFAAGLEGLLTPAALMRQGYCEYNCNLCGQICPTKAIAPLALSEKQQYKMGTAIFIKDRCIPYRLHENCIVCEEHCPLPQKAIKTTPRPYYDPRTGQTRTVLYPEVDEELCIGCGICENKCPLSGEAGIIVIREGETRWQL